MFKNIPDIHPKTAVKSLKRDYTEEELSEVFDEGLVAALVGMSVRFVRQVLEKRNGPVSLAEVLVLLDQDAFSETFVPRSQIPSYLLKHAIRANVEPIDCRNEHTLLLGSAKDLIPRLASNSVQCVVTSTPYWGMRIYEDTYSVEWADGEVSPLGHEQTPEGFIRHTIEILYLLKSIMSPTGSIWWNLMDTYNTRTQIRSNAAETLRAMNGKDNRSWGDYECRRYSAGHSFLEDGEQCMIPARVAERASRIGYLVKSTITWKKNGSMPETVGTRVTRELEYIIHLSLDRSPYFEKSVYLQLPEELGGRNKKYEAEKLTDIWCFSTASGTDGHGAQFPLALASRCIALSTREGDLVLDPFIGSGTTAVAAKLLNRQSIGFDISDKYLNITQDRLKSTTKVESRSMFENNGHLEDATISDQMPLWSK